MSKGVVIRIVERLRLKGLDRLLWKEVYEGGCRRVLASRVVAPCQAWFSEKPTKFNARKIRDR